MTQTGFSNAIVNAMLGWLKGLAAWVLRLFNLSGGGSPLKFLANNWLKLLIICLIIGVAMDFLVWILRWRPYWVWFHKKRVIINDKNFFAHENDTFDGDDPWTRGSRSVRSSARPAARPARDWEDSEYVVRSQANRVREERRRVARTERQRQAEVGKAAPRDVFQDDLFNVNAKQKFSDKYEDEVFNVSNLPRLPKSERRPTSSVRRQQRGGTSSQQRSERQ